jgi:hypothetical protein
MPLVSGGASRDLINAIASHDKLASLSYLRADGIVYRAHRRNPVELGLATRRRPPAGVRGGLASGPVIELRGHGVGAERGRRGGYCFAMLKSRPTAVSAW